MASVLKTGLLELPPGNRGLIIYAAGLRNTLLILTRILNNWQKRFVPIRVLQYEELNIWLIAGLLSSKKTKWQNL
jgi:hypothetical protein